MTLSEAIAAATQRNLNFADVRALLSTRPEAPVDALNAIALEIARSYASRIIEFVPADALANAMFAFGAQHGCLGGTLHRVYLAFDAGEYTLPGDPPGTDPEIKYTRPKIAEILAAVVRSNKSLERTREG